MKDVLKRLITYKWNGNFISTIFKNQDMGTLSETGFNRIDKGTLTASNAFFVKLVCSVILIVLANYKLIDSNNMNTLFEIFKNNWFFPVMFIVIGLLVPNFISTTIKKNRYIKRYPRVYSRVLIVTLIAMIEIIVTLVYFICNMDTNWIVCVIGLITNFVNFIAYLYIITGVIDFCVYVNRTNLVQKNQTAEILGEYVEYF